MIGMPSMRSYIFGCGFFAYSWKLPAYNRAFYLQLMILAVFLTVGAAYSWSLFAYSGKVRLIRALRTVSKET